jgi:hypothetical protein
VKTSSQTTDLCEARFTYHATVKKYNLCSFEENVNVVWRSPKAVAVLFVSLCVNDFDSTCYVKEWQ